MEIWKKLKNYEKLYEISSHGHVRSCKDNNKGKLIAIRLDKHGYYRLNLSKNNIKKTCYIHRLVAENFVYLIKGKDTVNHKDGNRHNNRADNLEWLTIEENLQHAKDYGLNIVSYEAVNRLATYFNTTREVIYSVAKTGVPLL